MAVFGSIKCQRWDYSMFSQNFTVIYYFNQLLYVYMSLINIVYFTTIYHSYNNQQNDFLVCVSVKIQKK